MPTPKPTRTTFPTFTATPVPPTRPPHPTATNTATSINTPLPTDTPLPDDTVTPTATDTPTETPEPSSTPIPPTNTPPPPTSTPVPTPTPQVQVNSPVATPTPADGNTRPGNYVVHNSSNEQNCERVAVYGQIKEDGDKTPIRFAEIEVSGDDDDDEFDGPHRTKTDANGYYDLYIGHPNAVKGKKFRAKIVGDQVNSEEVRWKTSGDCNGNGTIQTMNIDWRRR
ncbi:hypothetical protein QUF63_16315 [Anaerolineales bacterium HSG25]|nr:hypothetical protein [Anaerolineales bacterium HSG25]